MNFKRTKKNLNVFLLLTFLGVNISFAKVSEKKTKPIEVLLVNALPGSGKSEVRRYLSNLDSKQCLNEFGIATTVQVDDFPYVHMMRRISEEEIKRGHKGTFFLSPAFSFRDAKEWGTLIHLVNEDYDDLISAKEIKPKSAVEWLFDRIDAARVKVGRKAALSKLPKKLRKEIMESVKNDAEKLLKDKVEEIEKAKKLENKTVVIEFSRGGADSAPMPLPTPYGYKYSLSQLSPQILEKASILYVWVTPEESRRKNEARVNPNDPGSILNHCVPRSVMYAEYGCDDIDWLLETSNKPSTVSLKAHGKEYNLPLGKFDNRVDRTTFTHADESLWKKEDVDKIHDGLKEAFENLRSC